MVTRRITALGGLSAVIVLLASCLSVLVARSTNLTPPVAQIQVAAPDFSLNDTEGNPVTLRSLRGQVAVVFFVDPRCPAANEYGDRIKALAQRYQDKPVRLLAIATGAQVNDSAYLQELRVQRRITGNAFPTLLDADGKVARLFGATVSPSFYVIGRHGILRYVGALDDSRDVSRVKRRYLVDAINAVLEDESVPISETAAIGCPIGR